MPKHGSPSPKSLRAVRVENSLLCWTERRKSQEWRTDCNKGVASRQEGASKREKVLISCAEEKARPLLGKVGEDKHEVILL